MSSNMSPEQAYALATDPGWLKQTFRSHLEMGEENSWLLEDVAVQHIWQKSKFVSLIYEAHFRDHGGVPQSILYVGTLLTRKELAAELKEIEKRGVVAPAYGPPYFHIPEIKLVVQAFPNDRRMRLLSEGDLHKWAVAHARVLLNGQRRQPGMQIRGGRLALLRYVPGKRFTARCDIRVASRDGSVRELSVVAKQLNDHRKVEQLYRYLNGLRKSLPPFEPAGGDQTAASEPGVPVKIPRALAVHKKKPVIFIEYLPGKNLEEALPELDIAATFSKVGGMLATFHRAGKRVRKMVTVRNELHEIRSASRKMGERLPVFSTRLHQLYQRFRTFPHEKNRTRVLLHGSFRLNHVFIHNGELALVDLDSVRMGPPEYDLANFIATLYYFDAQERITAELRAEISRHFLHGYVAASRMPISPRTLLWYMASLLINKQAYKYVAHAHDDCEEKINMMLSLAEQILQSAERRSPAFAAESVWQVLPGAA